MVAVAVAVGGGLQLPFLLRSLGAGGRRLLRWPETGASRPAPLAASPGGSPLGSAGEGREGGWGGGVTAAALGPGPRQRGR